MRALPFVVIGTVVLAAAVFGQQPSFNKTTVLVMVAAAIAS